MFVFNTLIALRDANGNKRQLMDVYSVEHNIAVRDAIVVIHDNYRDDLKAAGYENAVDIWSYDVTVTAYNTRIELAQDDRTSTKFYE